MQRINSIRLDEALPQVFVGEEDTAQIRNSQIWMTDLTFSRPGTYLVSAESGTGKSSMCSFIYGSRIDFKGKIYFNGADSATFTLEQWAELRREHLALLPQEMRLFPELTVRENILLKNSLTDFFTEAQIKQMLEQLGIEHKLDSPAALLSIGQQQRVALVRALCQPIDFLLLDEPVSHLDERNNRIVAAMIEETLNRQDAALITTSVGNHLLAEFSRTILL